MSLFRARLLPSALSFSVETAETRVGRWNSCWGREIHSNPIDLTAWKPHTRCTVDWNTEYIRERRYAVSPEMKVWKSCKLCIWNCQL